MTNFLKYSIACGLTAIACIILFSVYLKHCGPEIPVATETTIYKWREAEQKLKDSTIFHIQVKQRIHDSTRIVIKFVEQMTDSAARKCYDGLNPKFVCEAVLLKPLYEATIKNDSTLLALQSSRIAIGDSMNDYLSKKVAKYQQDEKNRLKGQKWRNVKEQAKGAGFVFALKAAWEAIKYLFK